MHVEGDSGSGRASSASSGKSEKSPKRTLLPQGGPSRDSWEDAADTNSCSTGGRGTPATTPDDEDTSMETSDGNGHHVPASKPRTKIKPKQEEATTTEKEHVNVVFIGHVGKSISQKT